MFKIAYDAGHYRNTPGKSVPKELDKNETREWILNDRVARYFAEAAKQYDVELLRVDDPTGNTLIELEERADKANDWGADFYVSMHHNAAGMVFSGGGIVAYILGKGGKSETYQKAIYTACIEAGGLKGNRSEPLATANFQILRETEAPAVLMEYGFMDSTVDAPVILTEAYSRLVAYATMEGIAKVKGLKKKEQPVKQDNTLYRVQTGAFTKKTNAQDLKKRLEAAGFEAYMVILEGLYKVQVGAYRIKENAETMYKKLTKAGFEAFITTRGGEAVSAEPETIKVGSVVRVKKGAKNYNGDSLASFVYDRKHVVKEISGNRVVITFGGVVVAAVHKDNLILV